MGEKRTAAAVAAVIGGAALLGASTLGTVAPRVGDSHVDARWARMKRYRYAHRGLHGRVTGVPENSLAAFERARDNGFGAEMDVRLTKDDRLVVFHDADTTRMCGVSGAIEDMTLDQVRALRLGGTDERIPTFEEAISVFDYEGPKNELDELDVDGSGVATPVIVEIKTANGNFKRLTDLVMEALDRHCVSFCIQSFDLYVLSRLRWHRPEVIRGRLAYDVRHGKALALPVRFARTMLTGNHAARPDFIAYRFEDRKLPVVRMVVGPMGAKPVYWTIRTEADLRECEAEGGVAIFEGFLPDPTC